ncbi:MAG: pyruvate kinase [Chloroflexota bacterium]
MPRARVARRTKIVCTLGPATSSPEVIEKLIRAGMNVARFNLSHGSYEEHQNLIATVRRLALKLSSRVAILIDLPGPKFRTGKLREDSAALKKGARLTLTGRDVPGDEILVPLNLPDFARLVKPKDTVLIDDGAIQLRVLEVSGDDVRCRVTVGGVLTQGRGVVVPGMKLPGPFLTESLRHHIAFALMEKPDYIALSFIQRSDDIRQVKDVLRAEGADIPIIAKIERGEALKNFDSILQASDAIMVARGDLGVDIPLPKIPLAQKDIIRKCNQAGKAVITATQMLESMMNSLHPMRAEVTDIANAIFDGTDAIMLSGETSIGKYPVQAVAMMAQVARETEDKLPYALWLEERGAWVKPETDELISYNACYTAARLKAAAIIAFTQSGSTARRVAKYRPRMPILAITPAREVPGRLELYWGVRTEFIDRPSVTMDELFATAVSKAKSLGLVRSGDLLVITGGIPLGVAGTTNLLKVEKV